MIQSKIKFLIAKICFVTSSAFGQQHASDQKLYDTIPTMEEHYNAKVKEFRKEKISLERVVFVGNSITEMGNWKELLNDPTVVNRGIGGDITFGVLHRLDEIISRKPSKLFLKIGINDIGKGIPETVIAQNVKKIVTKISEGSPATRIYLQSLLPLNPGVRGFPRNYDKTVQVLKANKLLEEVSKELHVTFINLYPLFLDSKGLLDKKYTTDGLHLNEDGYKVWVKLLKKEKYL